MLSLRGMQLTTAAAFQPLCGCRVGEEKVAHDVHQRAATATVQKEGLGTH